MLVKPTGRVLEREIAGVMVDESRVICRGGTAAAAYKLLPRTMTIISAGRNSANRLQWTVIVPATNHNLLLRDIRVDFEGWDSIDDSWVRGNSYTISYKVDYKVLNNEWNVMPGLLFWVATTLALALIFYANNEADKERKRLAVERDKAKASMSATEVIVTVVLCFIGAIFVVTG